MTKRSAFKQNKSDFLLSPLLIHEEMLHLINKRRKLLAKHFNIKQEFKTIEESCIPSYAHHNYPAALVAWLRLTTAARLYHRHTPAGDVLDFGSSCGELYHVLKCKGEYHYIETNEILVDALTKWIPSAQRQDLCTLENAKYGAIFALDVFEHLDDIKAVLDRLLLSLRPSGILVLSGPTENFLYRVGRKISGFGGHYHTTDIYYIETLVSQKLNRLTLKKVPWPISLFRVSTWESKQNNL